MSREALAEMLEESDARTLRQFLITTFHGLGAEAADKILAEAERRHPRLARQARSRPRSTKLHEALQNVNLSEGQSMNVLRYANRVPLQFQAGGLRDHADRDVDQLAGLRAEPVARLAAQRPGHGDGPHGQRVGAVHQRVERGHRLYPEIQKELRLALQAVGRKLGMYLRRRLTGEARRRAAEPVPPLPRRSGHGRQPHQRRRPRRSSTSSLLDVAKKTTAEADVELDDRGKPIEEEDGEDFGENVLIVEPDRTRSRIRTAESAAKPC